MRLRVAGVFLVLAVLVATPAWALRIYGATSPGNQTGTAPTLIDLGVDLDGNDLGDALEFNVAKRGPGIITFSAECATEGTPGTWVSIQVMVNGTAIGQSAGSADAFCAANNTNTSNDGWLMGSITIPFEFEPGNVSLQVQVTTNGGATGWWLGDAGLSVILQKR